MPYTWGAHNFSIALPHWSLTEFFEQLELFLYGEFTINHKAKHIGFAFTTKLIQTTSAIKIEQVVNEYTTAISQEDNCDYLGVKNLVYADNDNRFWGYRSCEWYIQAHKNEAVVYNKLSDLLTYAKTLKESGYYKTTSARGGTVETYTRGYQRGRDGHKLFYAKDADTYFIMFCYKSELIKTSKIGDTTYHWYKYYNRLEPINQFGSRIIDKEADDLEIKIVPAWIDDTDEEHGPCLFLEPGEMGNAETWVDDTDSSGNTSSSGTTFGGTRTGGGRTGTSSNDDTDYDGGALAQGDTGRAIAKGEVDKADAYYDCIYIAFWDGTIIWRGKQPCPIVDRVMTDNDFTAVTCNYSLRLNHVSPFVDRTAMYHIDGKKKYNFSFLADEIPDPRALFYINGGKYLCEKLTSSFTENGRSRMIKGVFYRLQ